MASLTLRLTKGTPLTNAELDANFTALNTAKLELGQAQSSGTANGLLFLNGTKLVSSGSALTFDGTTLSIAQAAQGSAFASFRATGGSNNPYLLLKSVSDTKLSITGDGATTYPTIAIGQNNGVDFVSFASSGSVFNVAGSEAMRLTATGLGIGTTSPSQKLDVAGNARFTGQVLTTSGSDAFSAGAGTGTSIRVNAIFKGTDAAGNARTSYVGTNIHGTDGSLEFSNNIAGLTATISPSGNLLIGTTTNTNSSKLVVNGTISETVGTTQYQVVSQADIGTAANQVPLNQYLGNLAYEDAANIAGPVGVGGNLTITGNLGVGTTSPTFKVDVSSSASGQGIRYTGGSLGVQAVLGETAGAAIVGSLSNHALNFFTNSTSKMTLDASGNLSLNSATANGVGYFNGSKVLTSGSALTFDGTNFGVGTAAGYRLDVATGATGVVRFSSTVSDMFLRFETTGGTSFLGYTGSSLAAYAGGAEQMRLTSTGLGIGTSSPVAKLEVAGGASSITSLFKSSSGTATNITLQQTGVRQWSIQLPASSNDFIVKDDSAGVERLRIDASGNLGLGVTPSAWTGYKPLQAGSGASFGGYAGDALSFMGSNTYNDNTNWKYILSGNAAARYQQSAGVHAWYTAPSGTAGNAISFTQAMTLDAGGNLGIGTTSPSSYAAKLVNYAASGPSWNVVVSGANQLYMGFDSSLGVTAIESTGALVFATRAGFSESARIDASGNLGIGTSSPAYKLDVVSATAGIAQVTGGSSSGQGSAWYTKTGSTVLSAFGDNAAINGGTAGVKATIYTGNTIPLSFSISGAERMLLDSSGNLGLGVTPSAWGTYKAMQIGSAGASIFGGSAGIATFASMGSNYYFDGSVNRYVVSAASSKTDFANGAISWFTAPSGTAGDAISFTQAMTLDASGNLGLGVTNTSGWRLNLSTGAAGNIAQFTDGISSTFVITTASGSTASIGQANNGPLAFLTNNTERARISSAGGFSVGTTADPGAGAIYATGNITAYYSSDAKFKENITDIPNAAATVCAIGGKLFDWTDEYIASHGGEDGYFVQKQDFGVIAQDVRAVFPRAVREREDGSLAVDYEKLSALALAAISEQDARIREQQARIDQQDLRIARLEQLIEARLQ